MRTVVVCVLLAGSLFAKPPAPFDVVDDWRIDGEILHAAARGSVDGGKPVEFESSINLAEVARRLEIKEDDVQGFLRGLDPKLPLLVEHGFYKTRSIVGIWPLTEERVQKELRVELTMAKTAKGGAPVTFEARLVNAGKAVHRVVKPNDGSESGWREPEVCFEREVDGKWVRGNKPGRCGMFAQDWQKDIVDLKPGEALPLEGYLPPEMSFDLSKEGKARLRAVYIYRGGFMARAKDGKLDPGPMGKTPSFTLVSEPVEIEIR